MTLAQVIATNVTLRNVYKSFGKKAVLKDISFEVLPGELFAILGPSGAGKSTTLNIIAGLIDPTDGEILMDGVRINGVRPQDRDVAMVFESYALYPHFTVFDNIAFPLRAPKRRASYSEHDIRTLVKEVADFLEIGELLDRYPRALSGGQRQRVALGRALIRRPKVFLLDEPIAHLDAKLRHRMRIDIKSLQRKLGITMILATPDYKEAVAMADRVAVLANGTLQQVGTPFDLVSKPSNETVAKCLGEPAINLLPCMVKEEDYRICFAGEGFHLFPDAGLLRRDSLPIGGEVRLGIWPSDIKVQRGGKCLAKGEVYVFEPLGTEAIVTLQIGNQLVKAKCSIDTRFDIGEEVGIGFDWKRAHVFDVESGRRIE